MCVYACVCVCMCLCVCVFVCICVCVCFCNHLAIKTFVSKLPVTSCNYLAYHLHVHVPQLSLSDEDVVARHNAVRHDHLSSPYAVLNYFLIGKVTQGHIANLLGSPYQWSTLRQPLFSHIILYG